MASKEYRLVSLVNEQHCHSADGFNQAVVLWLHHCRRWGLGSCFIEREGVELDPVRDLGISRETLVELGSAG